jgi:general stress protein CsbA
MPNGFPRDNTASKTSKIYLYILIGVVVLGAGYVVYTYIKKRNKKDKK